MNPRDPASVLPDDVCVASLQALLDAPAAFTRGYAFEVRHIEPGICALWVPFQPVFERPGGIVSGPVFFAAADVAMWLAIKTRRGLDDTSVTSSLTTDFLRSARREGFVCTARVLKLGRQLTYGVAECRSAGDVLLSHHSMTYVRPQG